MNQANHYDVIVLGAGAAGLMCALTAGHGGKRVLVLEKSNKPAKKSSCQAGGAVILPTSIHQPITSSRPTLISVSQR